MVANYLLIIRLIIPIYPGVIINGDNLIKFLTLKMKNFEKYHAYLEHYMVENSKIAFANLLTYDCFRRAKVCFEEEKRLQFSHSWYPLIVL